MKFFKEYQSDFILSAIFIAMSLIYYHDTGEFKFIGGVYFAIILGPIFIIFVSRILRKNSNRKTKQN